MAGLPSSLRELSSDVTSTLTIDLYFKVNVHAYITIHKVVTSSVKLVQIGTRKSVPWLMHVVSEKTNI